MKSNACTRITNGVCYTATCGKYIASYIYCVSSNMLNNIVYGATKKHQGLYTVDYFVHSQKYTFPVHVKTGFKHCITRAQADDKHDITTKIIQLAGPNVDFYGAKIKVTQLGYKKITISVDDEELVFNQNDIIKFE